MDGDIIPTARLYLKGYGESIDETDRHYNELQRYGRYDPCSPYVRKYITLFIIEFLEGKGEDVYELKNEFNLLNEKLVFIEKKYGKDYRDKLFDVLKAEVKSYPGLVCYFFELGPKDVETDNDLIHRDTLEVLLMELNKDYDLSLIGERVFALDEALKCKYMRYIEKILEVCVDIERPYYPDRFWWRHPSKILSEKEKLKHGVQ